MSQVNKIFAQNVLEVLSIFVLNPDEETHQSKIAKQTKMRLIQVQRALERLKATGLITATKRGNMVFYKAITDHPLFNELKNILLKTTLLGDTFKQSFQNLKEKIQIAFIYGSYASGEETIESDIDLFIIGEVTLKNLSAALGPISRKLHKEINPMIYSIDEYKKNLKNKQHFLMSVLKSDKIWIIGNENGLKQLDK